MKVLITLFIVALSVGCATQKEQVMVVEEVTETQVVEQVEKPKQKIVIKATIDAFSDSDPLEILATRVEGDKLFIDVSYSGGCKKHGFSVVGSGMIMKSLPPKRTLKIIHDANEDNCRSIVRETLEVDVSDLKVGGGDPNVETTTVLRLMNWKDDIIYTHN